MSARLRVLLLCLADLTAIYLSWLVAVLGYRAVGLGHYAFGAEFYLRMWPVGIAFVLLNIVLGLYHRRVLYPAAPINPVEELRRLVGSAAVIHLMTIAVLALAYQSTEHYSRVVIVMSGVLTAAVVQPIRDLVRMLALKAGVCQIPVALIGNGERVAKVRSAMEGNPYLGFTVKLLQEGELRFEELRTCAKKLGVRILVSCQDLRVFRCRMSEFAEVFPHVEYIPTGDAFPVCGTQVVEFDGIGAVEMVNQRHMHALRIEKWLLDKFLALVAFLLLLPFFIAVPILIKLTSRGPVFYRQDRLGRNGRRIRVWKFRSMYADADKRLQDIISSDPLRRAEWERNFKLANDPRITPLGRFLRKTSIDEFPQLFNVFAGDMALVGPRPIVQREVELYGAAYDTVSSVDPGITGLWQVSGRSNTDYARRVALDAYYVMNWSPWMDLWILSRTVGAVLLMRGAC